MRARSRIAMVIVTSAVMLHALVACGLQQSSAPDTARAEPIVSHSVSADDSGTRGASIPSSSGDSIKGNAASAIADKPPMIAVVGATKTEPPNSWRDYQQSLKRACQTDADCVVKNVGNCCGYLPQCVHKAVPTFPEQMKALCEQEGRSSICGFVEPAGCSCVNNQCRNAADSGI